MATDIVFGTPGTIPQPVRDEAPEWVSPAKPEGGFPDASPDAPYGYKADGTPRKRRPNGAGPAPASPGSGVRKMPTNPSTAKSAAGLLARLNLLVGLAIHTAGLEDTAAELRRANEQFEELAYEALLADPQLCKKILGAGASSGKAGLVMAYSMLGIAIVPAARTEISERRREKETSENE